MLGAVVALTDPAIVILGGTWGSHPAMIEEIRNQFRQQPRSVPVRAAHVTSEPALRGTHGRAVEELGAATLITPEQHRATPPGQIEQPH